jgi:hypothetical protein
MCEILIQCRFSDVSIRLDAPTGNVFAAHKFILCCRSDYFRAMFTGGLKELIHQQIYSHTIDGSVYLVMTDCMTRIQETRLSEIKLELNNVAVFEVLLRFVYTGTASAEEIDPDLIMDLFVVAHQFGANASFP